MSAADVALFAGVGCVSLAALWAVLQLAKLVFVVLYRMFGS